MKNSWIINGDLCCTAGKKIVCVLFCVISCLCSCVTEEQFDNTPQGNFEALWKTIDQHYCFFDYKKEAIGLDWDVVHDKYSQQISDDMTSDQLFEVLSNMLSELKDGHVNLTSASNVARNWSYWEDHPLNFYTELQQQYLGNDYRIASGLKYRILDDNIGYIAYNSFSSGIGDGNVDVVLNYLKTCSGLIIDVRNNGGGQLYYEQTLASHFTNQEVLTGYISHKTGTGHNDFSTPEKQYIEPSSGIRWQKPVIVLTNRRCYSATNTFVRDMLCFPNVRTLGDQTGGGSGLPFSSELPNGWSIRFSACEQFDANMNHIEFGIQPTIQCSLTAEDLAKGKDTLIEKARELLK